jgi:RNA recognition motif-containing protein
MSPPPVLWCTYSDTEPQKSLRFLRSLLHAGEAHATLAPDEEILLKERRMDIYVGNLAYEVSEDALRAAFAEHGEVSSARVITDRETGRARGFGFVEMPNAAQAEAAIQALNGQDLQGRTLTVNESKPREGGGGRGYGGGGGGGGGGGPRW